VFVEITGRQAQVLSHPTAGQYLGESGGLIPQVLWNAFARMRAVLTPVFKLGRQLVELVIGMERGVGLHDRLPVVEFL
jgi:hypothetical protein